MTTLHLNSNGIRNLHIYTKGTGIIFDNNSDINAIPKRIFREIKTFYFEYQNVLYFETKYKDNYELLLLSDFYSQLEVLHFILEDKGITFPVEELFRPMENDSRFLFDFYGFRLYFANSIKNKTAQKILHGLIETVAWFDAIDRAVYGLYNHTGIAMHCITAYGQGTDA